MRTIVPDDAIDRAERGSRATLVKGEVAHRLHAQEERILATALTKFRNGLLTADQARDAIAQLSALRDLVAALDKEISRGTEARETLMSPGHPNGQRQGVR